MMKDKINKTKIIITFIAILLIPALLYYLLKFSNVELTKIVIDEVKIQNFVQSFGIYSPIIFILICLFTVIFPPTPNLIPMIAGGILFGTKIGIIYAFIGIMLGSSLNFLITRIFGRKIIRVVLHKEEMNSVDKFSKKVNWRIITILPWIPGMYADLGGYSAGLTKINFWKYFFATSLGYSVLISTATVLGKMVISNIILRNLLIIILIGGLLSIFGVPLIKYFLKKKSVI